MSCAYKAYSSPAIVAIPSSRESDRPVVLRAILAAIDAFQEALEMRRVAQRSYFLGDE